MSEAPSRTKIGFGGGCHWCTEAVFQSLRGVCDVRQGFAASDHPDDAFSEAVILRFEPRTIPLEVLIGAHLATHASTSDHAMRGKYRSAVYVTGCGETAAKVIDAIAARTGLRFVTRILPLRAFRLSDPRFHDYYAANPARPFCRTYIDPKLARLRSDFADFVR